MTGAASSALAASFLRATAAERVAERGSEHPAVRGARRAEEASAAQEARAARDVPAGFAAALHAAMQPAPQREQRAEAPAGPETELEGGAGESATGGDTAAAAGDARDDALGGGASGTAHGTMSGAVHGTGSSASGVVAEVGAGQTDASDATTGSAAGAANAAIAGTANAVTEAAAIAAATPARAASSTVVRDMDALAPEFRGRLGRVMSRMRNEFGHDVQVVETLRSQARQDQLHAQGRTEPGPVVTWTHHSKHGDGLAADLMVDGRWDNAAGYARLQQVAREEGLRTLGARDPGHLELATGGTPGARAGGATAPAAAPAPGGVAVPAAVAAVATVAQVAQVAQVATPGVRAVAPRGTAAVQDAAARTTPASPASAAGTAGGTATGIAANGAESRRGGGERRDSEAGTGERGQSAARLTAEPSTPNVLSAPAPTTAVGAVASSGDIAAASAAALTPLDRLVALQDAAAGRPLSQLTLRLDGPQGVEERIRVDLRGNTVGATLDLGDRASVEQITSRLGELRQSLAQRGLDSESLLVRQRAGASDGGDVARLVAATLGDRDVARASGGATFAQQQSQQQSQQHTGQQGAQQHSSPRDRDGRAPHDPTHDPAYDPTSHEDASSRHRSRREPKGEQR